MILGNMECPNCGASFEFDSEKSVVTCPFCKFSTPVRNVKVTTVVNNYYNGKEDDDEKFSERETYKGECSKLVAYALQDNGKALASTLDFIFKEYPDTYFFEVIRIARRHNYYYAFFQSDKYFVTKRQVIQNAYPLSDSVEDILERSVQQNGIWFNETKDLEQFVEKNNIENEEEIVTDLEDGIIYFQSFVDFAKELEESSYAQKYMKYDFEKEHYQSIMENAKDARLMLEKWKEKNRQLTNFVLNNRMKCKSFITQLENEQKNSIYHSRIYTGNIIEGESTGLVCGALGLILIIVDVIILSLFGSKLNDQNALMILVSGVFPLISFILMYICILRHDDGEDKKHWLIFLIVYPVVPFYAAYHTIRAIIKTVKSKSASKVLNSTINSVEMLARRYKNSAIYTDLKALELASGVRYEDLK